MPRTLIKPISLLPILALLLFTHRAAAIIYLADNGKTLESLTLSSDIIAVGKVTDVNTTEKSATLTITTSLKGLEPNQKTITITAYAPKTPHLLKGDRVVIFATVDAKKENENKITMLARLPLRTDAEEKTAITCYAEIAPHAKILADLADESIKPNAQSIEKLTAALDSLSQSKNAFTQIILGRLMAGPLTTRIDPTPSSAAIINCLKSTHPETTRGAAGWAEKSNPKSTNPAIVVALQDSAKNSTDPQTRTLAQKALAAISKN